MLKLLKLIAIGLFVAFLIVVGASHPSTASIPTEKLQACIPNWNGYFDRVELIGQTRYRGKDYFLLYLYQPKTQYPDPLIISLPAEGGNCTQEFLNVTGDDISFSKALKNREIGRQLKLSFYQQKFKQLGREGLQRYVNEKASEGFQLEWYEEDVWALQQLGITIPANVRVIS
jgi:hypothetical protein